MPGLCHVIRDCICGSLADLEPIQVHPGHTGLSTEGYKLDLMRAQLSSTQSIFLFGEHYNRTPFRSFIRKRRELRGIGELLLSHAWSRDETRRLTIAERDRPSLIEQKRIDVTGSFHGSARHREDVVLH